MELLLVFLSTAVGTVVGVAAAIIMMNRRGRTPAVGDAAVRTQLQNTEWALASAARDVEDLRKQLAERDGAREELERTQQQLTAIAADQERQSAERAAFVEEAAVMRARLDAGDASAARVIELEAALAAAERGAAEIAAQIGGETARLNAEIDAASAAVQERAAVLMEEVSGLELALSAAEKRANDADAEASSLRERVEHLTADASAAGVAGEEAAQRIASLEAEADELRAAVDAQRERYREVTSEASQLEGLLRNERRAAVEAMELLSQAQEKFSGATRGIEAVNAAGDAFEFARRTNGHVETVERG
jgi:chromosome segregation ATPase